MVLLVYISLQISLERYKRYMIWKFRGKIETFVGLNVYFETDSRDFEYVKKIEIGVKATLFISQ